MRAALPLLILLCAAAPVAAQTSTSRGVADVPYRAKPTNPVVNAPLLPKNATEAQRRAASRAMPSQVDRRQKLSPTVAGFRRVQEERLRQQRVEEVRKRFGTVKAAEPKPKS